MGKKIAGPFNMQHITNAEMAALVATAKGGDEYYNTDLQDNVEFDGVEFLSTKDKAFAVNTVGGMTGDVIVPDGNDGNFFDIYLDRPTTRIAMPINIRSGENYKFQIRQDGIGGREVIRGDKDTFTGLNCSINIGMGGVIIIYIHSGTFDWDKLKAAPGRKSFINTSGFANNVNNLEGLKVSSFDEVGGTITCEHLSWGLIDENTVANITLDVENDFYFTDEQGDDWIGQFPYGVSLYNFYSTSGGESGILSKCGVFSNNRNISSAVRYEERLTDDFINGNDNGLLNWREGNSNGSITTSSADVDGSHMGMIYIRLNGGATADGRAYTALGNDTFDLSKLRSGIEGICKFNENALETADVKYYFGWFDNHLMHSAADGAYFEIVADGSANGLGRVYCVTENANTRTAYDTGIDLAEDEWFNMKIEIPSNGGPIKFVLNELIVHKADRATMGITVKLTCGFGAFYDYTGTALPTSKDIFIDAFSLKYRMSEDRVI